MRLYPSLISRFMSCPLQARYAQILDVPRLQSAAASFGTCVHEALELYNVTGDLDAAIERFRFTWRHPEELDVVPDYYPQRTSYNTYKKRGETFLKEYHERNQWVDRAIIASEHRYCVPFGDHELTGIVDSLEVIINPRGKARLKIVDFKTNTRQPTKIELELNVQFTSYWYASQQPEFWMGVEGSDRYLPVENGAEWYEIFQDPRAERQLIWYHLNSDKELNAGIRDENDILRLYRVVEEINKAVEKDVYIPNISGSTCTFCEFTEQCVAVGPVAQRIFGKREKVIEQMEEDKWLS